MQDYFFTLADKLNQCLQGDEVLTCVFAGEATDFVRFNHAKVRQAGHVKQQSITLDLIAGKQHAAASITLSGVAAEDQQRLEDALCELRDIYQQMPEDPYLLYATDVASSTLVYDDKLPAATVMTASIVEQAQDLDLVGILASGPIYRGFSNSLGQYNWYSRPSFNFDWSVYAHSDKAVKSRYAGFNWQDDEISQRLQQASQQLDILNRPEHELTPGSYRVYLSPMAVEEIVDLLSWGGFGLRAQKTGSSPLMGMIEQGITLHPGITLTENTAAGIAPDFQAAGFKRPGQVPLIENGCYKNSLVSPRSAAEYGVVGNGAGDYEGPLSLDMAAGELPSDKILSELDTGLYIGNLWYLNYSDRNSARITGMTRFASFWVENGVIQAPLKALRFDDSIYELLGSQLLGLTREREMLLDASSYGARSTTSARLPGALIQAMRFTL